jgi:hypothetical protein
MQSIQLTIDGSDWLVVNGDIVLARGAEATRGLLLERVPVQRGEWSFDLNFGTNWNQLMGKTDPTLLLADVVRQVALVPGTVGPTIGDFELSETTEERELLIEGNVRAGAGETIPVAFVV